MNTVTIIYLVQAQDSTSVWPYTSYFSKSIAESEAATLNAKYPERVFVVTELDLIGN